VSGPLDFGPEDREDPRAKPPAPAEPPPPARPPGASRYTWFLGVVAVLLLAVVTLNAVRSEGVDTGGPGAGGRLAPFAVPLAEAPPRDDEDANVDGERACRVRGEGILNICEETEQGPVAFALFPVEAVRCRAVLDQLDRVADRVRGVRLVAVGSRGDRADLRGEHPYPVGWDRDGAVASVYGLVGCPQITFAERGGRVVESTRAELTDAELVARLRRLAR